MSTTVWLYLLFLALTGAERLFEVSVAKRNAAWSLERGGEEYGAAHYPVMVVLHTGFLLGCAAEVLLLERVFVPWIGLPMLAIAIACQALRWWCITTLGPRWNTRVIIVPGLAPITGGPYRYLAHPNYVAVVSEGIAIPMVHGAWLTALIFTVANAALLSVRIRVENEALATLPSAEAAP